ncbi:serine hydrolase domain-containing protein [Salinibacter altiplanensis]|uniref:serine hydrolase domain-containing protein n=1 Tax=Salinibacter altiplanensis TaxID=1803181 RepID=UPI0012FFD76B|nr:serine hydrolase [Salinibacter altiplanensis]
MRLLLSLLLVFFLPLGADAQGLGQGTAETPVTDWPSANADTMGLSTEALQTHLDRCKKSGAFGCLVAYEGHVVQEWYRKDHRSPFIKTRSAVKSWTGLLAGMLIADGAIDSVGVPVAKWIPEWTAGAEAGVTIRHLLTMTSGLSDRTGNPMTIPTPDSATAASIPEGPGVVAEKNTTGYVLDLQLDFPPGKRFSYSNEGVQLLSPILERAAGMPLVRYAHERLFGPLGMENTRLMADEYYNTVTFGGAETTLTEFARVGQLMLNEGRWNGRKVVPASWVERSTTPIEQMPNYGLLWWIDQKRNNYAATGSLDNVCIVFPGLDLVVARMQRDPYPGAEVKYQSTQTLGLLRRIVEEESATKE